MIKNKRFTKVGVVGIGGYVPKKRIRVEEIAKVRGREGKKIVAGLGVEQKAVADKDEDTVSLAVEAGRIVLARTGVEVDNLGAVLVGSESHPYAVKPSGTVVADILGIKGDYVCADLEFACKAGTTGIVMIAGMIEAGVIEAGMAVGADVAQAKPGDMLEYTAGAGAAAVILGSKKYQWLAELEKISSFNSDTADFWRRAGQRYPEHGGRFTGEPAYFKHVVEGTKRLLRIGREKISEFDWVVLHMPNEKFPVRAAKQLGVKERQLKKGLIVRQIGNPYSASAMLGLVKVMEEGRKGERVLMTSYGSGAGSDSMSFRLRKGLNPKDKRFNLSRQFKDIEYVNYSELCW